MKVDIKTVARKAGVSTATISRVLADFKGVREETRKKVINVIEQLNYEVNAVARSLRQQRTYTIGIIVGNVLSQFYSIIAKSVEDTAKKAGYNLILCNGDDDPQKELEYLKILKSNRVDGIILTPTGKNSEYINYLIDSGTKVVLLDRLVENVSCDAVLVDNFKGAYTATKYLTDQGYRKIAIITGFLDRTTGKKRLNGYLVALKEAGIKKDHKLIKIGDFKKESGISLTKDLISSLPIPEAIFVTNIDMTLGALIAIKEAGLKIPDDIGIVGFDDPDWSTVIDPPLTTINQPVYNLGATASEVLIKKIESSQVHNSKQPLIITLNTSLVIRCSTLKK